MKRTIILIGTLAASALLFSCSKNSATPAPAAVSEETERTLQDLDPDVYLLSFGGNFEKQAPAQEEADTKVVVNPDTGAQSFEDGDEVLVYVPAVSAQGLYVYDATEAQFSPKTVDDAVAVGDNYAYVYYPAGEFSVEGDKVSFTMPAAVTELPGKKTPLGGILPAGASEATFKNLGSILRFSFSATRDNGETLTAVELSGEGVAITGKGSVTWSEDTAAGIPQLSALDGDNSLTLTLAAPLRLTTAPADVFFFLPPSGQLANLTVKAIYGKDGVYAPFEGFRRANAMTLGRGNIVKVGIALSGFFGGGDGSAEHPYVIASANDFKAIATLANATSAAGGNGYNADAKRTFFGSEGVHYQQTADIDFENADISAYMIASASTPFAGTYDGDSKALSNFTISGTPDGNEGVAPFKAINGAVLKNIAISGATVTGGKFTAGLVGYAKACTITGCSIENSTITSDVNYGGGGLIGGLYAEAKDSETSTVTSCSANDMIFTNTGSGQHFGGLICYINGVVTVEGCSITGTSTVNGTPAYFGGIVGQTNNDDAKITGCENHSTISGVGNYAGGIVGQNSKGSIQGCTNDGSIAGAQYVGGIVGINAAGKILGCTNTDKGTITSKGDAGGIAGQVTGGTIQTCKNSGNVNASGNNTGGIAGSQSGGSEILECWSNAQITGQYQTGGIVGHLNDYGAVVRCTAKGDVSGTQCVGGIVGHAYASNTANARGILVMECLSKANVTASTGTNSNSGGVIGRLHSNRVTGGSIQWANVFQCVGWSATIKNTNTDACTRFGAFVGFLNTEYSSQTSTQVRCQVRNSYTTVATDHMIWLAGTPSSTGGFVGQLQRGRFHGCYYQLDNNTQSATASKNLVVLENFTKVDNDFATYLMSNLETTADNNYTGNGKSYAASAWTMTGYNGESLEYPLPSALVALGTEYYD